MDTSTIKDVSKDTNTEIAIINKENINDKIYEIRGQQVMLDSDLAEIYGYTTKALNQQVKNNIDRFDEEYLRFQLTDEEVGYLRSKNFTANISAKSRSNPYAFTEQGIYMLMTVVKGEIAVKQSKALVYIFKQMKDYIAGNQPLIGDKSLQVLSLQTIQNSNDIAELKTMIAEDMVRKTDLPEIIRSFGFSAAKSEYLILNGETVEAEIAYRNIYSQAKESIYMIDNYINIKTLYLLNDISSNINITIFSDNIGNKLRQTNYNTFIAEYPSVNIGFITTGNSVHDRYIILDFGKSTEQIYLCGASSKDAGNKVTTISKLSDNFMFNSLINNLKGNPPLILN